MLAQHQHVSRFAALPKKIEAAQREGAVERQIDLHEYANYHSFLMVTLNYSF
jgi:hypothetical protein